MEVLFEYSAADYRSIIFSHPSKLCRNIEYHLQQAGVSDPEVTVLSYAPASKESGRERTRFFLQRWDNKWSCYVNVDSLEEIISGDRLTVAKTPRSLRPKKVATEDTEVS